MIMLGPTGPIYFVFCRLYHSSSQHHGSVWLLPVISPLLLYRRCGLAYPYEWRGFVGPKKKTRVSLLVFNPLWFGPRSPKLNSEYGISCGCVVYTSWNSFLKAHCSEVLITVVCNDKNIKRLLEEKNLLDTEPIEKSHELKNIALFFSCRILTFLEGNFCSLRPNKDGRLTLIWVIAKYSLWTSWEPSQHTVRDGKFPMQMRGE